METPDHIQEKHLEFLVSNEAFNFTDNFFLYTSGEIGNYYVNSEAILKNGYHYREAVSDMKNLIDKVRYQHSYDLVSGGESRDWIFSYPLAFSLGKPHVSLYKNGKIIGGDLSGKETIHIADLNNEGSSPRDKWLPLIKREKGEIKNIFFYVDRCEQGLKVMKNIGLESSALVYLDEKAWNYLLKINVIDSEIISSLRERREDKDIWARKMIVSEKGIERIAQLLETEKKSKMMNFLTDHYSDLKEEVFDKLKKYSRIEMLISPEKL